MSARFTYGVHDFRSASVFLNSCFLSLQSVVNFASARFTSGVHDFRPTSVLLDSYFLSLQKFNPRIFFLLTGRGYTVGAGSSAFAPSIEVDMKRPIHSISNP